MESYSKKAVFDILAITGSIVTISVALIPKKVAFLIENYQIVSILVFLGINLLAFYCVTKRKESLTLKINESTDLQISYGDIFDKSGINIIPVNDFFDTIVDNSIVSEKTLHGLFINKYFSTEEGLVDLNKQIATSLASINYETINRKNGRGKKKKYPLGTTAIVKLDDKFFFLVVVSEFNIEHNKAFLKISDYPLVLSRMIEFINNYSQGFAVNIPLIGGAHLGIDLPKEKLLELIVFSIHTAEKIAVIDGINIVLHSSVEKEINLNKVNYIFKKY